MRRLTVITVVAGLLTVFGVSDILAAGPMGPVQEGSQHFWYFFYKWMRDDDGDGIPNGQDDDWVSPGDCTGYGKGAGDGVCDGDCDGTPDRKMDRKRDKDGLGGIHRYSRTMNRPRYRTGL